MGDRGAAVNLWRMTKSPTLRSEGGMGTERMGRDNADRLVEGLATLKLSLDLQGD